MRKIILALGAILLVLSLSAMPVSVAGEKGVKADSKTAATPAKCWQKLPPLDERNITPEYNTVCKAYEEVLNATCEPPEKLQCNWTLPEGERRFKKLEWKSLDSKEYHGFIDEMVFGKNSGKERWKVTDKDPEFIKAFEEHRLNIKMAIVDIDNDGQTEYVVHENWRPECLARGIFGVMIPETKRVDWKRNKVFFHVNGLSEGSEIMLYEGKVFAFKIENRFYMPAGSDPTKEVMLYELFSDAALNECRFKYLKGGAKQ